MPYIAGEKELFFVHRMLHMNLLTTSEINKPENRQPTWTANDRK